MARELEERKMAAIDIVNVGAGLYKGYMNAVGVEVDPIYLAYSITGSSALSGIYKTVEAARYNARLMGKKGNWLDDILRSNTVRFALGENEFGFDERNPPVEGVKAAGFRAIVSALEITVGYGIGWVALKITS